MVNQHQGALTNADFVKSEHWLAPTRQNPLDATISIPGSKSLTNRWLILAAMADTPSRINLPLRARDTDLMISAISSLGSAVENIDDDLLVTPGVISGSGEVDCGLAGTVMRFVPPIAALVNADIRFDGDPRARVRPMKQIIDSLRILGAQISDDGRGTLPFTLHGKGFMPGGEVELDASASSQFISALLLAGARYDAGLKVIHSGGKLPSLPHIEMTVEVLAQVGIPVVTQKISDTQASWVIEPGIPQGFNVTVEPDLSNAAPFVAAALVTGGSVTVKNWPTQTNQAGDALRQIIPALGGSVERIGEDLKFSGSGTISGIDIDLHEVGELTPVIAALCALAESPSQLRGIGHLRGHETDRLAALTTEINNLGGDVTETEDGLLIKPATLSGSVFKTYEDHRMAMAAAVLGLKVSNLKVEDIETTSKTLPEFANMWMDLTNS